jgi:hypothetical protein
VTRVVGDVTAPEMMDAADVRPRRHGRRLIVGLLVAGFVIQLAWRLWLAVPLHAPVVLGDESRYLIFARVLAGGPGGFGGDTDATRRVGYALLISPAYWFTSDPFVIYRLVQGLNAVLNALTLPLAYLFARRILGAEWRWAMGIAFAAASLPAVVFFAPFALPNAVLTPLLLGWLLALHGWMTASTVRWRLAAAIGSGALVGFMYVVHVRALLLLGVHLLVAVGLVVARRVRLVDSVASAASAGLVMVLHPILKGILAGRVLTGGTEPQSQMVSAFTTVDGILRTVSDATGQIWYVCIATWGLGALGLVLTGYRLAVRRGFGWPTAVVLAACLASTLLTAIITSAALPNDGKINNHMYPGYIIFLAPIWVMVGLAALRDGGWRRAVAAGAGAAGLLVASWFVVALYTRPLRPLGPPHVFSPIDAPEALFLGGDWAMVELAPVTALVFAMIVVTIALMAPRRPVALLVVAVVAATALSVAANQVANDHMAIIADSWSRGPRLVRDAGVRPDDVVAEDGHVQARFNHQREVYWRPLLMIDLWRDPPPAEATVVVAPWSTGNTAGDWDGEAHGWRRVAGDPANHFAVWRRR